MKPRINDITLKVLADYYAFFLNPFIYKYTFKHNPEKSFEIWFDKENFCHLLGLETIAKYSVPFKKLHNYKDMDVCPNVYFQQLYSFLTKVFSFWYWLYTLFFGIFFNMSVPSPFISSKTDNTI